MPGSRLVFDWDDANTGHIARHNVTPEEVEERSGEERHTELGETASGRLLLVAWTWRGRRIRVVTAFPANRKWRVFWRRIKEGEPSA